MATTLRGGIVGCGFFGQIQLEAWRRIPGVEMVAAADADIARAHRCGLRAHASLAEMLDRERLDFVDIATRPDSHPELVRRAVERHIPVICQKPMANTWAEAVEMAELADAHRTRVMIHENWRWQPWYREAKRLIADGTLGRPLAYLLRSRRNDGRGAVPYPNQPYFNSMPRLLIFEMLIHQIDTARFLFGDIRAVYAETQRLNEHLTGEDRAVLTLTHEGVLTGVVDGHRYLDPLTTALATLEGEEGTLSIFDNGEVWFNGRRILAADQTPGYKGDSVRATQEHFVRCLRSGAPFETSAREYLKTFGVMEAAYRSAASGRKIRLGADGSPE